jgi:hypothetical protein
VTGTALPFTDLGDGLSADLASNCHGLFLLFHPSMGGVHRLSCSAS